MNQQQIKDLLNTQVWLKKHPLKGKLDDLWQGPFTVIAVGSSANTVTLDMGNCTRKVNVKQIRRA